LSKHLEIYFHDLCEETKAEVLEFYGVRTSLEMNWDISPLFILDKEEEEKENIER